MPYDVLRTNVADKQIAGLRGPRLKAYKAFKDDLIQRGCAALDYRLTGDQPLPNLCVKHLRGKDRVVVVFAGLEAWVLLVGPHDEGDLANNVYSQLYELAGVPAPAGPRTKPSCCGDDSSTPVLNQPEMDALVQRARRFRP